MFYDGTLDLMAKYAFIDRNSRVKIFGGCCGIISEHSLLMRSALEKDLGAV